jgi:hypothetical protein
MTILTIAAGDDRVILAVDTLSALPDGGQREVSKLRVIPHINVALAVRGVAGLLINAGVLVEAQASSFDDAVSVLEQRLPFIVESIASDLGSLPADHHLFGPLELTIAGWSNFVNRMVALRFHRDAAGQAFAMQEIRGLYAAPMTDHFTGEFAPDWVPDGDDDIRRLACAAVASGRGMSRAAPRDSFESRQVWGGRLVVADLSQHAVSCRTLGALD